MAFVTGENFKVSLESTKQQIKSHENPIYVALKFVWLEEWKSGRMENIWFSILCVWLEGWKSGRVENFFFFGWREKGNDEKCNLYKLTIIPLLHNM